MSLIIKFKYIKILSLLVYIFINKYEEFRNNSQTQVNSLQKVYRPH